MIKPIIGQEAVCPDGLGRVAAFKLDYPPHDYIKVDTYINNNGRHWAVDSVNLIPICATECVRLANSDDKAAKEIRELTALVDVLRQNVDRCVEQIKHDADGKQRYNDSLKPTAMRKREGYYRHYANQFIETLALDKLK